MDKRLDQRIQVNRINGYQRLESNWVTACRDNDPLGTSMKDASQTVAIARGQMGDIHRVNQAALKASRGSVPECRQYAAGRTAIGERIFQLHLISGSSGRR